MEYQKVINFLNNISNRPSKFKTKNQLEINHESRGTYNEDNQVSFKTSMLRSRLCDYGDVYILFFKNIAVANTAAQDADQTDKNKKVIF